MKVPAPLNKSKRIENQIEICQVTGCKPLSAFMHRYAIVNHDM